MYVVQIIVLFPTWLMIVLLFLVCCVWHSIQFPRSSPSSSEPFHELTSSQARYEKEVIDITALGLTDKVIHSCEVNSQYSSTIYCSASSTVVSNLFEATLQDWPQRNIESYETKIACSSG